MKWRDVKMNKILSFVVNEKNEFLLLKGNSKDLQFKNSLWYVVTGGCEDNDSNFVDAVKREVLEETNLEVIESMYLNWIFEYNSLDIKYVERAYLSKVKTAEIVLNEENVEYKWCELTEFINMVDWFGKKEVLAEVLIRALFHNTYFKDEQIDKF
jgi:8-oxo-dGTP pyrophosphatase MutT (NUDIX family)